MDVPAPRDVGSAPAATKAGLLGTLGLVGTVLCSFEPEHAGVYRALGALVRPCGRPAPGRAVEAVVAPADVAVEHVPYPILLPIQLALLAGMAALSVLVLAGHRPGPELGDALVWCSFAYWASMGVRYARRMFAQPDQRWFGGAIPIVFHCVLAGFVFVLGASGGAL
jgi:hypothetical protein